MAEVPDDAERSLAFTMESPGRLARHACTNVHACYTGVQTNAMPQEPGEKEMRIMPLNRGPPAGKHLLKRLLGWQVLARAAAAQK